MATSSPSITAPLCLATKRVGSGVGGWTVLEGQGETGKDASPRK